MRRLDLLWYRPNPYSTLLSPLSWLFCLLVGLRRAGYRLGWLRSERLPVPVVVVGNITVGGTGKTPLVIWIAGLLARAGYRPGVISRGYGGRAPAWPQAVSPDSDPLAVGDEAVLIARRAGCPVAVGPDRVAAARMLLERTGVDVIVSDDGMQHYRLARDLEVAVIDGVRRLGNGRCLPAGPLRERAARLREANLVVANGEARPGEFPMGLAGGALVNMADPGRRRPLDDFRGQEVHGMAGIGNPQRFFDRLREAGVTVREHAFADHHPYRPADLEFGDDLPVLMTEKDAVKCRGFCTDRCWYLPVEASLPEAFGERLLELLRK